jgi:hypothetical protein
LPSGESAWTVAASQLPSGESLSPVNRGMAT